MLNRQTLGSLLVVLMVLWVSPAFSQNNDGGLSPEAQQAILKAQAEKAKAEAEKAQAEAEKAKAEAEIAKIEAAKAKAEAEQAQTAARQPQAVTGELEAEPTGVHTHDGFFLRFDLGLGYTGFATSGSISASGLPTLNDPSQNAFGSTMVISLGGCPRENLALHVDFMMTLPWAMNEEPTEHMFTSVGLGLGLTRYFMPQNFFITGSIGIGGISVAFVEDHQDTTVNHNDRWLSATGMMLSLMVGKEWWVSDNWGLGLAFRGQYGFAFASPDITMHHGAAMAVFTATYN